VLVLRALLLEVGESAVEALGVFVGGGRLTLGVTLEAFKFVVLVLDGAAEVVQLLFVLALLIL
jgi:hypothetical protein